MVEKWLIVKKCNERSEKEMKKYDEDYDNKILADGNKQIQIAKILDIQNILIWQSYLYKVE